MKNKYILIILFAFFVLPIKANCSTGSIKITCDKTTALSGATITCKITGTTDGAVAAVDANVSGSSNLTFSSFTPDSSWQGSGEDGDIKLYTDNNKTGTFNIGTLVMKVKSGITNGSDEKINLISVSFVFVSGSDFTTTKISETGTGVDIRIPSTINTLSNIQFTTVGSTDSIGTLNPKFDSNTLSYATTFDSDLSQVNIKATATDSKSSISGNVGTFNLNYGNNTAKINVTSESGEVKTYTISIVRPDNRSTDNTLSSLKITGETIALTDGVFEYDYQVDESVSSVSVEAVLNDELAKFKDEDYSNKKLELEKGKNIFYIKVVAENGNEQVYILNILRGNSNAITDNQSGTKEITNPKTGTTDIVVKVIIIMISALAITFIIYKKKFSKNGENINEK